MTLWLVAYQLPFDLIVGIHETEDEADKDYDRIPDKYAPLKYSCPSYMVSSQSGFRNYHAKILDKMLWK